MNQEVGSIMGYCYSKWPVTVYPNRIPEQFMVPCIYIPPPIVVDGPDTVSTFLKTYSLPIKIFHSNSQLASEKAEEIADAIRASRYLIPLLNQDGSAAEDTIRVKRVDTRQIEDGVAQLTVTWDSRYLFDRLHYEKMGELNLEEYLK